MTYIFDTSVLIIIFRHFYRKHFASLWNEFERCVADRRVISVREAGKEIDKFHALDELSQWKKDHQDFFHPPLQGETEFIREIFTIPHFRQLVSAKKTGDDFPVADPFVIAKAKLIPGGCVVTQEVYKPNAAKIPNVCKRFKIRCINLEGFMEDEGWSF